MAWREEKKLNTWTVPYLPIDPVDVGRTYDSDVIRINSQSGKGGISYILKQNFSISVPEKMREEVGYAVKQVSDEEHKELSPQWVYEIFEDNSFIILHTSRFPNNVPSIRSAPASSPSSASLTPHPLSLCG